MFSAKSKASGEVTTQFNAKSQAYKDKALSNSAKIDSGEANAPGSTKTQTYRTKAQLSSAKKASCEAKIASCKARTITVPSGVKASNNEPLIQFIKLTKRLWHPSSFQLLSSFSSSIKGILEPEEKEFPGESI